MITIPAIKEGEALRPAEDLSKHSGVQRWVCDGINYTGYEEGDEQPAAPEGEGA